MNSSPGYESAAKSVVEHKGSAGRRRVFRGYLLNYQQDTCTAQSARLYGKCRVLKSTDATAFALAALPWFNRAPGEYVHAKSQRDPTSALRSGIITESDRPQLFHRSSDRSSSPAEGRRGGLELAAAGRYRRPPAS